MLRFFLPGKLHWQRFPKAQTVFLRKRFSEETVAAEGKATRLTLAAPMLHMTPLISLISVFVQHRLRAAGDLPSSLRRSETNSEDLKTCTRCSSGFSSS